MADPSAEVRRCQKCGASAVVLETNWRHTTWGVASGQTTRDYRCQGCGRRFTLQSRAHIWGVGIAGVLLLPTCIGLPVIGYAWWRHKLDEWNPVVPGAPRPSARFALGPPSRRCGKCGGHCVVTAVTAHVHNGLPTGTEYEYACQKCRRTFTIESVWGQMFSAFSALVVAGGGVLFLTIGESAAWRFGGGSVCLLIAALWSWSIVSRAMNRIQNPATDVLTP